MKTMKIFNLMIFKILLLKISYPNQGNQNAC